MMKISDFNTYWDAMATRVNATKCILVRTEPEMAQKIKNIDANELFLVAVVPSSDTQSRDIDNIMEKEMVIVYALMKVSHKEQNDADMVNDMGISQECITAIKTSLMEDSENHEAFLHQYIKRIDFSRMHTDPEYNYMECDGYSLSFELISPSF